MEKPAIDIKNIKEDSKEDIKIGIIKSEVLQEVINNLKEYVKVIAKIEDVTTDQILKYGNTIVNVEQICNHVLMLQQVLVNLSKKPDSQ